jgi:ABC-type amino acid transport substrate-binding protein
VSGMDVLVLLVISGLTLSALIIAAQMVLRGGKDVPFSFGRFRATVKSRVLERFRKIYAMQSFLFHDSARGILISSVPTVKATVGDLVILITVYVVTGLLLVGWVVLIGERADTLKLLNDEITAQSVAQEITIRDQRRTIAELTFDEEAPQLLRPSVDEHIIGDHVDFEWQYGHHNDSSEYLLQLILIPTPGKESITENAKGNGPQSVPVSPNRPSTRWQSAVPQAGSTGDIVEFSRKDNLQAWLLSGRPCTIVVSDSTNQRSRFPQFPVESSNLPDGRYIWRVAFGTLTSNLGGTQDCIDDQENRNWSSYGGFTIYSSRRKRINTTRRILVGTTFSQSLSFTRIGSSGIPEGFDLDLATFLVNCLAQDPSGTLEYIPSRCAPTSVRRTGEFEGDGLTGPVAEIVPIRSRTEAMDRLQSKDIDLYIGSCTKAVARERDDVRFTKGYLRYKTELLVRKGEECETLKCLDGKNASVGTIAGSSSMWLANAVKKADRLQHLKVVPYATVPELDRNFEQGNVTAVIVDGTIKTRMRISDLRALHDLQQSSGWQKYLGEYIGDGKEQFGIAVGTDPNGNDRGTELLDQVDRALQGEPSRRQMQRLFEHYKLGGLGVSLVFTSNSGARADDASKRPDSRRGATQSAPPLSSPPSKVMPDQTSAVNKHE